MNANMTVKDKVLTITIDLSQDHGPSKSGKSIVIATTGGNISVPDYTPDTKIGLNVYRKA